ncbi:hypothetical protein [Marinobacterium sediminicola]|uniref:Uncharacterized protein n=1 Tax=Marinobacterium sediminicola TaxID=518898 RepID=A0ABY1RXC0_9GAMM|nr:hypothetical protein [Marinobacterium sediminicola]ULG67811.1 hypothetical protein LN244_08755 [Marinobacterium sediminicola]SMR71512.1 hypothetical protein SAMN04487964_102164 [Marinobacterium sediminicola]
MHGLDYTARHGLTEFFRRRLQEEADQHTGEDTRWYLGNLLARFTRKDALFSYEGEEICIRPLALIYGDAQQCHNERERCLLLRQLGDQALFMGALFPEHYARKGIQRDYFIGMGSGAYSYLAGHARDWKHVFAELAARFAQALELIARICHRERRYTAGEIMALYQRWLCTRNPALADQLIAMGISLDTDSQPIH